MRLAEAIGGTQRGGDETRGTRLRPVACLAPETLAPTCASGLRVAHPDPRPAPPPYCASTGIPIIGQISHTNTASTTMSTPLAGRPVTKNSFVLN